MYYLRSVFFFNHTCITNVIVQNTVFTRPINAINFDLVSCGTTRSAPQAPTGSACFAQRWPNVICILMSKYDGRCLEQKFPSPCALQDVLGEQRAKSWSGGLCLLHSSCCVFVHLARCSDETRHSQLQQTEAPKPRLLLL